MASQCGAGGVALNRIHHVFHANESPRFYLLCVNIWFGISHIYGGANGNTN